LQFPQRGNQCLHSIRLTGRAFLVEKLVGHVAIDVLEEPESGIFFDQPVRVGDGPLEDRRERSKTVDALDGLARLPALRLLRVIFRFPDMVDGLQGPIDLSIPGCLAHLAPSCCRETPRPSATGSEKSVTS